MAPTCCGKKVGRIGTSFGISFLQIGASLKKACGFERERVTFVCETTYAAPLIDFFTKQTYNYMSVMFKFGIIPGSFGPFYALI
jgi:hypothetical protein